MAHKLANVIETQRIPGTLQVDRKRPRGFYFAFYGERAFFVRKGYSLVECTGEAHTNPHIDNCMRCAPLWGVVAVADSAPNAVSEAEFERVLFGLDVGCNHDIPGTCDFC